MSVAREIAAAKINLALHVRGKLPDGRHAIETIFAFCIDGDRLSAEPAAELTLGSSGLFSPELPHSEDNLVLKAARALQEAAGANSGAAILLEKRLPVASGIGGGSADAAAALRLLTSLWNIDPAHAERVAPALGSDVPACLLSLSARGEGAGDRLQQIALPEVSGMPVLLVNPRVQLSTAEVFARWDGIDHGPLGEDWRHGRNDLQPAAVQLAPQIETVLAWLSAQIGATLVRMSGSGATCFALFDSEVPRDRAAEAVPREWWHLATSLR
ncbi:4-(cytidine 5'-diphospho)-2-C-methyl-D-erythritol kinase [Sphingomonas hankyongi]|uniref:4-diphosphocytidyl-2-C-methyl-D-erythritol kinase n=1 Tax=Sphingomonas hankyongi TaxID=2908209 RepID=A0ABT0S3K7_9SPHN|nr:4-(cytidine 5'-diphospho)-2-C-methyl-D-erythritol kinase [Sphingomonas hankyongi]MCL6730442.1 4-(cytidine 5'-diphospho)-2-C-methyl-D-erythritol kinase [Sphingomonas hankyongi]